MQIIDCMRKANHFHCENYTRNYKKNGGYLNTND